MNKRRFFKLLAGLPFLPKVLSGASKAKSLFSPIECVTTMAEYREINPKWITAEYGDWQFIAISDEAQKLSCWVKRDDTNN